MRFLAAEVDKIRAATGATKVVLFGNSRGGNAIRHYIANGGGADKVSHAILGGTPNHGVRVSASSGTGNEFNGAGPFLMGPERAEGSERRRGLAGPEVDDDPLRQQRQVRAAGRRVDRRARHADRRRPSKARR
jgi:pimeloyl-ACP methyl ester carboxylesterase